MTPRTLTPLRVFALACGALWALFLAFQWTTPWQWSVLMDDIAHLKDYSVEAAPNMWQTFLSDVAGYAKSGRLHPIKYIANSFEYRFLRASPFLPHLLHTLVLIATLIIGARTVLARVVTNQNRIVLLFILAGLGLLQRPLLDMAGLVSIAEVWTALLLVIGVSMFPDRPVAYRFFFLLCAFSKEPAVTVFGASALVHLKNLLVHRNQKVRRILSLLVDLCLFVSLAMLMRYFQQRGSYLSGYNLLDPDNVKRFALGAVKCGIGVIPVLALVAHRLSRGPVRWRELLQNWDLEWFCLLFAIGYLILVTPRGVPGYLLIPPTAAIWLIGVSVVARTSSSWNLLSRHQTLIVGLLIAAVGATSLVRYVRFIKGINEGTTAFHLLRMTRTPRIVVSNAMEASMTGTWLAEKEGAPVKFYSLETTAAQDPAVLLQGFQGEVVLMEFTQYFGRLPPRILEAYERYLGGWKSVMSQGVYRIFYGGKPPAHPPSP